MKVTIENIKLKNDTNAILVRIYHNNTSNHTSFSITKDWHKEKYLKDDPYIPYIIAMKIITNINGDAKKLSLLNCKSPNEILSEVSNTYLQKGGIKIEILN